MKRDSTPSASVGASASSSPSGAAPPVEGWVSMSFMRARVPAHGIARMPTDADHGSAALRRARVDGVRAGLVRLPRRSEAAPVAERLLGRADHPALPVDDDGVP